MVDALITYPFLLLPLLIAVGIIYSMLWGNAAHYLMKHGLNPRRARVPIAVYRAFGLATIALCIAILLKGIPFMLEFDISQFGLGSGPEPGRLRNKIGAWIYEEYIKVYPLVLNTIAISGVIAGIKSATFKNAAKHFQIDIKKH